MVFSNQGLNIDYLDNMEYITEEENEKYLSPNTIPIIENQRLNTNMLFVNDLEKYSKNYDITIGEAACVIAERHSIDPKDISIVVDDYRLIENPNYINEQNIFNPIINNISSNSLAYQFCEACINEYAETGDEAYLNDILDETQVLGSKDSYHQDPNTGKWYKTTKTYTYEPGGYKLTTAGKIAAGVGAGLLAYGAKKLYDKVKKKKVNEATSLNEINIDNDYVQAAHINNAFANHINNAKSSGLDPFKLYKSSDDAKQMHGAVHSLIKGQKMAANVASARMPNNTSIKAVSNMLDRVENELQHSPKTWIARKVASLRTLYYNWLMKAQMAKDTKQAGLIKRVAAAILNVIDKLLLQLQKLGNSVGKEDYRYAMG